MEKIPFEDGTKIKDAVVEINEQEYTVTAAQYTGNTPLTAANLNQMQDNIEESAVVVSSTQPTTSERVWIRKGKNLFNGIYNTNYGYSQVNGTIMEVSNVFSSSNMIKIPEGATQMSCSKNRNRNLY